MEELRHKEISNLSKIAVELGLLTLQFHKLHFTICGTRKSQNEVWLKNYYHVINKLYINITVYTYPLKNKFPFKLTKHHSWWIGKHRTMIFFSLNIFVMIKWYQLVWGSFQAKHLIASTSPPFHMLLSSLLFLKSSESNVIDSSVLYS